MGFFKDIWDWIKEKVADLVGAVVESVSNAIRDITAGIRMAKHAFNKFLAKATKTDGGVILTVAVAIAVTVLLIKVAKSQAFTIVASAIDNAFKKLKTWTGTALAFMRYREALAVHRIWLIFDEKYQKLWHGFYKALAQLSTELGDIAADYQVLTASTRTLFMAAYSVAGYTPDEIEIRYWTEVTSFWQKVDKDFNYYAKYPERILTDIDKKIVGPAVYDNHMAMESWYRALEENERGIVQLESDIAATEEAFRNWINAWPNRAADNMEAYFGPYLDDYEKFREEEILPFIAKMQAAFDVVNDALAAQEAALARQESLEALQAYKYGKLYLADPELFGLDLSFMKRLLNGPKQTLLGIERVKSGLESDRYNTLIAGISDGLDRPVEYNTPEAVSLIPTGKITFKHKTWFIGEY